MSYTIKEVSEMTGLSIPTLRYYDREGLLPSLKRKQSGYRVFTDDDLTMLNIITSFKRAGMQIKDIQHYIALAFKGESTLQERYDIFLNQEQVLKEKIADLHESLEVTRKKISFYQVAIEAGTEAALLRELCIGPAKKSP